MQLRGEETREVIVTIRSDSVLESVRREWLTGLFGKAMDQSVIREGHWYHCWHAAYPDEEWQRHARRSATPSEIAIWEGLDQLEYFFKAVNGLL
jgi:hypothetical protein